jgi:hypothetical protein
VVKKPAAPVKAARPAVDPFVAGEEGDVKRWEWNKKEYVRDGENYIWLYDMDKEGIGAFQGRYNYEKDVIEECAEPEFEDETCEEIDLGL